MNNTKLHFIFTVVMLFPSILFCKVDPPNFNFSLDQFNPYLPGKVVDKNSPENQKLLFTTRGKNLIYRFWISHQRYKFPLFVQTNQEGRILDSYARLPSYFLHDTFHQSLINRYAKQDNYYKKEDLAIYVWKEAKGLEQTEIVYSGTCTITCFPVFVTFVSVTERSNDKGYQSLLDWAGQSGLSNFHPSSLRN